MASEQPAHKAAYARNVSQPSRQRRYVTRGNFIIILILLIALWLGSNRLLRANDDGFLEDFYQPTSNYDIPSHTPKETDRYLLGVGKADITGPVVEINLMGYADSKQVGSGLRQRLYSRAFIVGDLANPTDRFVYLVLDLQSGDTAVRYGILSGLRKLGPEYSMYGHDNLAVTATHSHSGPGAWLNYLLPQITSKGFDKQSYRAIVDGCVLSIRRAHESLSPGHLTIGTTKVMGANINRSLFSYMQNPEEERARYNISTDDDGSVEKDLTLLKFQRESDGKNIGVLTWFPTHGTSMTVNNTLISGDNKGAAADMFEKKVRSGAHESADFVAGFSQANMGNATPNVLGAWCEDGSGNRCDFKTSSCANGRCRPCHGRGPFYEKKDGGASSCLEIGRRQYQGALDLYNSLKEQSHNIRGVGVKAIHEFHDMANFQFELPNGTAAKTCPAALGYTFAAGTSDEPGHFDIIQHASNDTNSAFTWRFIRWLLKTPSEAQKECQSPKTILLDVGEVSRPYQWTPNVVDIQTFRVGQLLIVVSPGEATTMAGRRWKESVATESKTLLQQDLGGQEPMVVIGAPSNSYTHYITTAEEYGMQRYEGASTLYGPNTLAAYVNRTIETLPCLAASKPLPRNRRKAVPRPPDNSQRSISFIAGVVYDRTGRGRQFGDVSVNVPKHAFKRGETAEASFIAANPRNNLRLEQTFAAVEHRLPGEEDWGMVRDDSDWGLLFRWKRTSAIWGTSEVTVSWEIEDWTPPGEYRLRYYGDAKSMGGKITAFEGVSRVFMIEW